MLSIVAHAATGRGEEKLCMDCELGTVLSSMVARMPMFCNAVSDRVFLQQYHQFTNFLVYVGVIVPGYDRKRLVSDIEGLHVMSYHSNQLRFWKT